MTHWEFWIYIAWPIITYAIGFCLGAKAERDWS